MGLQSLRFGPPEPGRRHGRSQERLLAKKGKNFLYVNSGQMVADTKVWES